MPRCPALEKLKKKVKKKLPNVNIVGNVLRKGSFCILFDILDENKNTRSIIEVLFNKLQLHNANHNTEF